VTAVIDDPEADVARASAAVTLVTNRLSEAQADLAELRRSVAESAFLAEIDSSHRPALLELRARLAAAESRVDELTQAAAVGRDMAAEAQRRVLEARRNADWAGARALFDDAMVSAAALDSLAAQLGDLYRQLQQQMNEAAERVGRHLARPEYNVTVPNIELNNMLRLVLSNHGGPEVDPSAILHLDPGERAQASLASLIEHHARQVMGFRPMDTTEQEDTSHGD